MQTAFDARGDCCWREIDRLSRYYALTGGRHPWRGIN